MECGGGNSSRARLKHGLARRATAAEHDPSQGSANPLYSPIAPASSLVGSNGWFTSASRARPTTKRLRAGRGQARQKTRPQATRLCCSHRTCGHHCHSERNTILASAAPPLNDPCPTVVPVDGRTNSHPGPNSVSAAAFEHAPTQRCHAPPLCVRTRHHCTILQSPSSNGTPAMRSRQGRHRSACSSFRHWRPQTVPARTAVPPRPPKTPHIIGCVTITDRNRSPR
jgi:hypothetical protein